MTAGIGNVGPNASLVFNDQRGDLRVKYGQTTTATASDTVVTGLSYVLAVVATLDGAPVVGATLVQATTGDQAGTPAAGSFLLKTYKPTATADTAPTAATTFSIKVNWIAVGY